MALETNSLQSRKIKENSKISSETSATQTTAAQQPSQVQQTAPQISSIRNQTVQPKTQPPNLPGPQTQQPAESQQKKKHAWWFWIIIIIGTLIILGLLTYFILDKFKFFIN